MKSSPWGGKQLSESEFLYRVRVEPVIAGARVVLATGGAFAYWLDPSSSALYPGVTTVLFIGYVIYSVLIAVALRNRTWLSPPIQVVIHTADLVVFSMFVVLTEGSTSPFFIYFVFSVVCGSLRWESNGAIATAYISIAIYLAVSLSPVSQGAAFDRAFVRALQLAVLAALLGYLSKFQPTVQRELVLLGSWSQILTRDLQEVAHDIVQQAKRIMPGGDVVLVWEDPDEGLTRLVSLKDDVLEWHQDEPRAIEPLLLPLARHESFQSSNAADPSGRVRAWDGGDILERRGAVVTAAFRERFRARIIQGSRLSGGTVSGWIFWMNRRSQRSDGLIIGSLIARLAATRLESVYLVRRLEEAAAVKERLSVARDLHDTVLQTLTGTALQLTAATRLLESDQQGAALERLNIASQHVEFVELEMRALIRRLRPTATAPRNEPLEERLANLKQRIETQWQVNIALTTAVPQVLPERLVQQVMFIVNEAVLNAARHAAASTIRVDVSLDDSRTLRLQIADDGRGFPMKGVYDLEALNELGIGPKTVKERVTELGGSLTLSTDETGTAVVALLPTTNSRE